MQWVISISLGLWRGHDPAECTVVIHTPWATLDALGLGLVQPQAERYADNPLHKKNSIYTMVGKALTARPPDGF
jgi:type 1 glutamine amidotransferase